MTNSYLSIRVIGVLLVVLTPLYAPFGRSFTREKNTHSGVFSFNGDDSN